MARKSKSKKKSIKKRTKSKGKAKTTESVPALPRGTRAYSGPPNGRQKNHEYRAGNVRDHNRNWDPRLGHADRVFGKNIERLRARSRDLSENTNIGAALLERIEDDVVCDGIKPRPAARHENGNPLQGFNKVALDLWDEMAEVCDLRRHRDIYGIQAQVLTSMAEDGAVIVHMPIVERSDTPIPLQITGIPIDQLDRTMMSSGSTNEIRGGIEVDQYDRIVAFHVTRSRGITRSDIKQRIPANECAYVFSARRFGQVTGIPLSSPVISLVHDVNDYVSSELVRAREFSKRSSYIKSENPGAKMKRNAPNVTNENIGQASENVEEIVAGLRYLEKGEDIVAIEANVPPRGFDLFLNSQYRGISAGMGWTYEALMADFTGTHFSAARATHVKDIRHRRKLQKILNWLFNVPYYVRMLDVAAMKGMLPGVDIGQFLVSRRYRYLRTRVKWRSPGFAWHDPDKDVKAAERKLALGLTSRQRICTEHGDDFFEILDELREEEDALRDLPSVSVPGDLSRSIAQPLLQIAQRVENKDDDDDDGDPGKDKKPEDGDE